MKKVISVLLVIVLVSTFFVFAAGSGEDESSEPGAATNGSAEKETAAPAPEGLLDDFSVIIDSCRLAQDYEGKPVVIVKYIFENVDNDDARSFSGAIEDAVYQNGVGLNQCYFMDDNADYSADNQSKEIKKGASLEVEVAYELNDTTSDIEVEVKEFISFNDKVISKTFAIAE